MKELTELTEDELNHIADLFIEQTHSPGWKLGETKSLMKDDYMCFIEKPKEGWKENIINYLQENNYKLPNNRLFK